jgi:signal transduction histidine kinase
MQTVTVELIKSFGALANVPDEQLQWLIDNSTPATFPNRHRIIDDGAQMVETHFIVDGQVNIFMNQAGFRRDIVVLEKGGIFGYLPFSRGGTSQVICEALGVVEIFSLPTAKIREMVREHFELTEALVHVMNNRIKNFTALQQQNEKMMALGKLSAGLTHELNNPASAIVRDSVSLRKHLRLQPEAFKEVIAMRLEESQVDALNEELFRILDASERPALSLREKTKREEAVSDWLNDHGVKNNEELADVMVDFNFRVDDLEAFLKYIPKDYLQRIFNWISQLLMTEKMVENMQESSRRIENLLQSVKVFTHMDRSNDKQYSDIHSGIRNTITMFSHKINQGNVTVVEEYDETLPPVMAYVGELNQVWTNLIDNALDAMEAAGQGKLIIKTEQDRAFVKVTVTDNGPGIPENIRSKVFDPFFTTKEVGKGTGMGLDVVQRIVIQHRGSVKVNSVPGETSFVICFPIDG